MKWTMFRSAAAMQAQVMEQTPQELLEYIRSAGPFARKDLCPWVKLATFGNLRSSKNSLRNNANVMTITGVEGDYDAEVIQPEQAVEMLECAHVKAIIYTSPSHTDQKPRWRVLAPLSKEHSPSTRSALLARINGVLGGVLASESFTLSQSYYFGRVEGVDFKILATYDDLSEGWCVDELDELDNTAIRKQGAPHHADDPYDGEPKRDYSVSMFEDLVTLLGRKLRTGDGRRDMLKSYISSRSNRGLLRDELIAMVEGVVGKYFDPNDGIDQANVIGIIDDFVQKDIGKVDQPADTSQFLKHVKVEASKTAQQPDSVMEVTFPFLDAVIAGAKPEQPPKTEKPKASKKATAKKAVIDYPEPYPGVMQQIVAAANQSAYKPQPHLNMLAALIGMAACINGEYSMRSGGRFNLYGIGSLESGGGKDNPRMAAETLAAMGGSTILGKPGSGAGLEDALEARKNQLVSIDEMAHILKSMNDERAPAHIRDIGAAMLKLYSAGRGAYNKRILAKGPNRQNDQPTVANPCVSMIGFATPEGLGDAFNEANFTDGLMARMLFVPGDPTVVVRRPKHGFNIPEQVGAVLSGFKGIDPLAFAGPIASVGSKVVEESSQMSDLMDQLLVEMEQQRDKALQVAPSLYARSFEKMERIAGVLAIWDDPTAPVLRREHVEWARQMVMASDARILEFVSRHMHSNEITKHAGKLRNLIGRIQAGEFSYQRDMERIAVEEGSTVARSQLLRVCKLDKITFDRTLAYMQDLSELQAFDRAGKPLAVLQDISIVDG